MRKTALTILAISAFGVLMAQPMDKAGQHQNRAASLLLNHDFTAAIVELEQAASLYKSSSDWPFYFSCLNQITQAQIELGELDRAKQTAKKALWQSIETLSRNNDEAAKATHQLGHVYEAAGRFDDAMKCHRMGFDIREDLFSRSHPQTAASKVFMAITARKQGAFTDAFTHLEEAEAMLAEFQETGHPELVKVWEERGLLFEETGETEEAKSAYRQAIALTKAFPNQYPEALGRNWCRLARLLPPNERAKAYQRAYHLFEANERMQNSFAIEAVTELGQDALVTGQPELAAQMGNRASQHPHSRQKAQPLLAKSYLLTGQFQRSLQHFRNWINHDADALEPNDWSNAIKIALADGNEGLAMYWSKLYEGKYQDLACRYYVAKAYALSGNTVRARQILRKVKRTTEQTSLQAMVEASLARMNEDEGEVESAIAHYEEALGKTTGPSFFRIQMLAALGSLHLRLADQDRYTAENISAASTYFRELQNLLTIMQDLPLTPFESAWMGQHLNEVIGNGMHLQYLQQQYASRDFDPEHVYLWLESAKILLLNIQAQQGTKAPVFWKYCADRLVETEFAPLQDEGSAIAKEWSAHQSAAEDNLRYKVSTARPMRAFQELLAELNIGSYHYWIADQNLYVFQLDGESGQLYRKNWTEFDKKSLDGSHLLLPELQAQEESGRNGLVLFPTQELAMFPFEQVPVREKQLLGNSFKLYRHLCASTFLADRSSAGLLPGEKGTVCFFQPEPVEEQNAPVALPTSNALKHTCLPVLDQWVQSQTSVTKVKTLSDAIDARVLFCSGQPGALTFANDQSELHKVRYLVLDGARTDFWGNSTEGLINKVIAQQHYAGTFIEQQGLCRVPEAYTAWLDAIAVEPNLTEKLPAMQSQPEYAVLNTIQTFGAPYPLSEGSTNPSEIPVFWILGGVLGLVLTGLWVRR